MKCIKHMHQVFLFDHKHHILGSNDKGILGMPREVTHMLSDQQALLAARLG